MNLFFVFLKKLLFTKILIILLLNTKKWLKARRSSTFKFCEDLIKHNMVVFREGEGALQVLPALVDILPEARLNLVIYYLRQGENEEAYELIKDLEPAIPQEYILKAIVNVVVGQEKGDVKKENYY